MKQMITTNKTPRAITVIGYCLLVIVFASCSGDGSQMRAQLEELERQNREYEDFTTDSLAKELVDYFDRHGTANERLRAHYILGCVYRDLGEAPRAVDCYLNAISQADTTAAECDYRTLSAVYSQMALLFHNQFLLTNEIRARKTSAYYAAKDNDDFFSIYEYARTAGTYILLNEIDSAEYVLNRAINQYESNGYHDNAIESSLILAYLYLEYRDKPHEAKPLLDQYEEYLLDKNLQGAKLQMYYYKAKVSHPQKVPIK